MGVGLFGEGTQILEVVVAEVEAGESIIFGGNVEGDFPEFPVRNGEGVLRVVGVGAGGGILEVVLEELLQLLVSYHAN